MQKKQRLLQASEKSHMFIITSCMCCVYNINEERCAVISQPPDLHQFFEWIGGKCTALDLEDPFEDLGVETPDRTGIRETLRFLLSNLVKDLFV